MNAICCHGGEKLNGLKIKLKRIEKGYKQYEFAKEVGISRQYLVELERGKKNNIHMDKLKRICELLDMNPGELFE